MKILYKKRYIVFLTVLITAAMILSFSATLPVDASTTNNLTTNYSQNQVTATGFSDIGALPSNQLVSFAVYVPLKNQQLLQSYVEQISNPQSSEYGHFLTLNQVEQKFTNSIQFNNVLAELSADNFNIQLTAMNSIIAASGTVAQIKSYLGLNVDLFSNGTYEYYSAYGNPSIGGVSIYASNYTNSLVQHPSTLVTQNVVSKEKQMASQVNQTYAMEGYSATVLSNVYNETGLMQAGYMGQNGSIGILDFYGNPSVKGQLSYFDQQNGLPAPPSFNIVPIGPYEPNMGVFTGWSDEVSLDVESSHAMSPLSNITLYVANGDLSLAEPIAFIDMQDSVNSLSQSFSFPESLISNLPVIVTDFNFILPDLFYELGSIEGITFSASTGDVGGSGFSSGPLGTPGYPSTSPYVTALGGTETYVAFQNGMYSSSKETAWSNYGFVPYNVNYGGGTGGVSMFEPLPWYQMPLVNSIPSSYPMGRLVPDVSLNAAVYPGINFIFGDNQTYISGGTSESSPLFAGLIAFSVGLTDHPYGLINPTLYQYGLSSTLSGKIFNPITFGYIIPWSINSTGYNLVTGLGSLNIGALSYFHNLTVSQVENSLDVTVFISNYVYDNTTIPEFADNSIMNVSAYITENGSVVTTGSFNATVVTLQGMETIPLQYNSTTEEWMGTYMVSNGTQGMAFVQVSGENNSVSGSAYVEVFFGYYVFVETMIAQEPYALQLSVPVLGQVSWLNGVNVSANLSLNVYSYSILSNSYNLESSSAATSMGGLLFAEIFGNYEAGATLLSANGAYLYLSFFNGVQLQNSQILGSVVSEPGAAAPGQDIYVMGSIMPSDNIGSFYTYENVMFGSNLTFSLVNSNGTVLNSVFTYPGNFATLQVPMGTPSGLYTVMISTSYYSLTYGTSFDGSFFGQIWVSSSITNPEISISPSSVQEGQTINITAKITQGNSPIMYGMYTATIYPASLSPQYALMTVLNEIPLFYNVNTATWEGTAVLPSGYSAGSVDYLTGLPDYAGPYDILVSGESWNGTLTNTSVSAQMPFQISSPLLNSMQTEINAIGSQINNLSSSLNSSTSSLSAELSSLESQLLYLNQTQHANVSSLISQINNLQTQLNSLNTKQKSQASTAGYTIALGVVALIIALAAIGIASTRRKKA